LRKLCHNPNMNKYIALDCETSGISTRDFKPALLTVYIAVLDENFNTVDELELKTKPDDGIYHVTPKSLDVNKINLVEHDKVAITYKEAGTKLFDFIKKNYNGERLIPVGHGIAFDCRFLQDTIISAGSWERFISYRTLDTGVIGRFLCVCGVIPENTGGLESLMLALEIPIVNVFHDAKTDTLYTVQVLKELIKRNKGF